MAGIAIGVGYDFYVGCVTNMMAATVLRMKGPSLLEDLEGKGEGPDPDSNGGFLRGFKMTNYPGPQEALDWWESDCRNTDGGKPKKKEKRLKKPSKESIRCLLANVPDTTIVEASKNGHTESVKILIDKGVDINTTDDVGYTSLSYAALKGHAEVVDLLIEYGAEINIKNHWGGTALVQAVFFGHVDIAKILIDNGANMNVTIQGDSLVVYAAKNGFDDLVDYLMHKGATYKDPIVDNDGEKVNSRFKKWSGKLRNGDKRS